jgi:hypothetical protein
MATIIKFIAEALVALNGRDNDTERKKNLLKLVLSYGVSPDSCWDFVIALDDGWEKGDTTIIEWRGSW